MDSLASLKIAINSGDIKRAQEELNKLGNTAGTTEKSTNLLSGSFLNLSNVLRGAAILGTAQQFIKLADIMTGVQSKLKLVTNNTLDLVIAQNQLFDISQKTRTSFATNVDLYQKMSMSTKELNLSQKDMFGLMNAINKSIAISGTNAAGAETLITQLGQAFSSNFQGVAQELGTLRDQAPRLYQAILEGTGMTAGAFKKAAEDGKLSSEIIIDALRKQGIAIDKDFGKVGVTVDASMTVLANSITNMIGKVDKQLGTTGSLGKLITDVSKHIDENTQDWIDSVQTAMDTMYPIAEAGFTNIKDLSEVTFEGINALFSIMVHSFDGAVDSMNDKYRELGFFDYMSLGFIVVIEGFRQIASGGLSALTFLGKQFNTFQSIALDAIAGVMGAMGRFQNAVGGDGSSFLEAQTFWANKANKVKQDGLLIDRTQNAILADMGKGVDRLIVSYDKLALKKVKAKEVDTGGSLGGGAAGGKGGKGGETAEQKKAREKAEKEAQKAAEELAKQTIAINAEIAMIRASDYEKQQLEIEKSVAEYRKAGVSKTEIARLVSLKQGEYLEAEYAKAEEQFAKLDEAKNASLTTQAQMMADNYLAMYDQHLKFSMSTYEYDMMKLDEQKEIYLKATEDKLAVDAWYEEQKTALQNKEASTDVSKSMDYMQSILDTQIALAESGQNWSSSLTGVAGNISEVSKAISKVSVIGLKTDKALLKSQEKYAKSYLEANGDVAKEKEAMAEFDTEQAKIKDAQLGAELGAYSTLAGAMAGFFEEGSKGAEAMTAVSATLGIAQGIQAVISAWGSAPFPANMPAVAATTAAVLPMIAQLTGMGGSGGSEGGASASTGYGSLSKTETIKAQYDPITDRLDKQIELLDSIDKNGSAQFLNVQKSLLEFTRDSRILIEDSLKSVKEGGSLKKSAVKSAGGATSFRDVNTFLEMVSGLTPTSKELAGKNEFQKQISLSKITTEVQNLISDFALTMSDSVSEMTDAKDEFKNIFDELTNTTTYASQDLAKALTEVNNLTKGTDLSVYLQKQISAIQTVEDEYGMQIDSILSMTNDFNTQVEATTRLNELLSTTFEAGTEDALNFVESIKLVSDSIINSNANIKDWKDGFKTSDQLANDLANTIGVTLAKDLTELNALFNTLSLGIDGLTDTELEFLNANKALIEENKANVTKAYEDSINAQIDATNKASNVRLDALKAEKSAMDKIRSAIDAIMKTANTIRVGADTSIAASSSNYKAMYDTIQKAMTSGLDYSEYTSDFNSYATQYATDVKNNSSTAEEAKFETLKLANEVEALAGIGSKNGNLWDVEAAILHEEKTLETAINNLTAQLKLDAMSSTLSTTTSSTAGYTSGNTDISTVGLSPINTASYVGDIGITSAKTVLDTIPTHYDDIFAKYGAGMDMYQWIPYNSGFGQLLSTWGALSGKAIPELGIDKLDTIEELKAYYQNLMSGSVEGMGAYNSSRDAMKALALMGYKSGGYTGDMATNAIAGVVHGKEYVVNAKTTQDLGLNNSAGVFKSILNELSAIKQMQVTQTSTQVKTLSTQNAILANVAS